MKHCFAIVIIVAVSSSPALAQRLIKPRQESGASSNWSHSQQSEPKKIKEDNEEEKQHQWAIAILAKELPKNPPPVAPVEVLEKAAAANEAEYTAAKDRITTALEASPEYRAAVADVVKLKEALKAARDSDDRDKLVSANAAYLDADAKRRELEKAAFSSDKSYDALKAKAETSQTDARLARKALQDYYQLKSDKAKAARMVVIQKLQPGEIGLLPPVEVSQVIDKNTLLVHCINGGKSLLIRGIDTTNIADDTTVYGSKLAFIVKKTESYTSVLGAKRTVWALEPYEP